jgi:hypothetical protein
VFCKLQKSLNTIHSTAKNKEKDNFRNNHQSKTHDYAVNTNDPYMRFADNLLSIRKIKFYLFIGIQPYGQFGQEPEISQATGMPLVRCVLGKFLGVVCHSFPPRLNYQN